MPRTGNQGSQQQNESYRGQGGRQYEPRPKRYEIIVHGQQELPITDKRRLMLMHQTIRWLDNSRESDEQIAIMPQYIGKDDKWHAALRVPVVIPMFVGDPATTKDMPATKVAKYITDMYLDENAPKDTPAN